MALLGDLVRAGLGWRDAGAPPPWLPENPLLSCATSRQVSAVKL